MQEEQFHITILKKTSLYGLSHGVKIIARLLINKFAAIFLGTVGIGIIGFLENILVLIQGFSNFSLATSSVREIAVLEKTENNLEVLQTKRVLKIIYTIAIATGILGFFIMLLFSKKISTVVFDDVSYYKWIIALGLYLFFTAISTVRIAVLQAKKKVKTIIKYTIINAIFSTIVAVLGYYYLGVEGIIPVFISTAFFGFISSIYFTRNIPVSKEKISYNEVLQEGIPILKLGIALSVSVIFGQLCFYGIRWYLKTYANYDILGIYQVGITILVGYLGLIFTTMSGDFYPRLCNLENDKKKFINLVNDQTEVALFLIVPSILILYLLAPYVVELLYSKEFLAVLFILKIGLFSVILKAIVWPLGFLPLVKGNNNLFLKQNLLGDAIQLITSIIFYQYLGLVGLGLAMVVMFLISGIYNYYIAINVYQFHFRKDTLKVLFFSILIGVFALLSVFYFNFNTINPVLILLCGISIWYSFNQLRKKNK